MAHLDSTAVLKIIHEARVDFFKSLGLSERNVVVGDLALKYQGLGGLFDEIQVDTGIGESAKCGFRMFHQLRSRLPLGEDLRFTNLKPDFLNPRHSTGSLFRPIALAEFGMVTVDAITHQPIELPKDFCERLAELYSIPFGPYQKEDFRGAQYFVPLHEPHLLPPPSSSSGWQ